MWCGDPFDSPTRCAPPITELPPVVNMLNPDEWKPGGSCQSLELRDEICFAYVSLVDPGPTQLVDSDTAFEGLRFMNNVLRVGLACSSIIFDPLFLPLSE